MKIDRRCFLSLGVGAVAGTALSPLPWKLMDDSSIWSQNWPWTPVPPDGKITYTDSTCNLCPGGCGISVRKIDNRVVKIEGQTGHPINDGGICALGISGPQLLYGPTRVKSPLKKVNGTFVKISWQQALSEIADKLKSLREQGKSHTVAGIAGSAYGTVSGLLKRFLTVYGSPNFYVPSSLEDAFSFTHIQHPDKKTIPGFDLEKSDYILSFGSGVIEGWGSPVRMIQANSKWKDGKAKLIQMDTQLTNTAAKADQWLACKPGTESVLALGIAHVLLQESLIDQSAVDYLAEGFKPWSNHVLSNYHPNTVAEITGVDPQMIITVGREFGRANKPIAIWGRGEGRTPIGVAEMAAVHALNILAGNINKPGGVYTLPAPRYLSWPEISLDDRAQAGLQTAKVAEDNLLHRLAGAILTGSDDPVSVLFISNANPGYTLSDVKTISKAFRKIPLKVSFSSYMDETAAQCDFILPNHTYLERYEDIAVTAGLPTPMVCLTRPITAPLFGTRHTGDVILELAERLKGSIAQAFPWRNYETCLQSVLSKHWKQLQKKGHAILRYIPEFEDVPRFAFQIPDRPPITAFEGNQSSMPLVLIPSDSMRLSTGFIGTPPFLMKTVPDTDLKDNDILVQINPKTAAAMGLKQNSYAWLKTPRSDAKVKINLSQRVGEQTISLPRGLGHTAYDKYLAGKGVNFNELIGPVEDPVSGLDVAYGIRASLTKA